MKELQKKIRTILKEIEKNLKTEEDIEFAKTKVLELYEIFSNELENLQENLTNRLDIVATKYSLLEDKLEIVENVIDKIKQDIYIEDKEEYDLDIVCPYCDKEFTIDMDESEELQNVVTCPKCNNIIELDWNDDDCEHDCSCCENGCKNKEDEEEDDM